MDYPEALVLQLILSIIYHMKVCVVVEAMFYIVCLLYSGLIELTMEWWAYCVKTWFKALEIMGVVVVILAMAVAMNPGVVLGLAYVILSLLTADE